MLTADELRNLRSLDPLGSVDDGIRKDVSADLYREVQRRLDLGDASILTVPVENRTPSPRPIRFLVAVAAAGVVLAVVGGVVALRAGQRSDHASADQAIEVSPVLPSYRVTAQRELPLIADRSISCGGVTVPIALLAAPGNAERERSSTSDALRHFLAHNPWQGMGSVTNSGWFLLAKSSAKLVFAQRIGVIGFGSVVVLSRTSSGWDPTSLAGCGNVIYGKDLQTETIHGARANATALSLTWINAGNCGDGSAKLAKVVDRVVVKETRTAVYVVLVSRPDPNAGQPRPACISDAYASNAMAALRSPLGSRKVIDGGVVPMSPVTNR